MKITAIETNNGIISVDKALKMLSSGKSLNSGFSQVVMGVYEDGRKTSLKARKDGFYYMSGNFCQETR